MTETETSADGREWLATVIGRLDHALARMSPGDVAALRRLRPRDPHCPAFWRLAAEELGDVLPPGADELAEAERRWAVILAALAEARGFHAPGRRLGTVLAEAVPEARVLRLLRAQGEALADAVRVTVHHLGARGLAFDATDLAWLVLSDGRPREESERRRIYRDFYAAAQQRG